MKPVTAGSLAAAAPVSPKLPLLNTEGDGTAEGDAAMNGDASGEFDEVGQEEAAPEGNDDRPEGGLAGQTADEGEDVLCEP